MLEVVYWLKILGIGACVVNIPFIAQSSVGAKAPRQGANFIVSTHKKRACYLKYFSSVITSPGAYKNLTNDPR